MLARKETSTAPIKPTATIMPANLIASKLMGRKQALEYLEKNAIDYNQKDIVEEELKAFLASGGEGIDLTFEEAWIIYGIAHLYTENEYSSHVECTEGQLYKAMKYVSNVSGWQRQRLRKALEGLSKKKFPFYWKGSLGWRLLTFDTLISVLWGARPIDGEIDYTASPTCKNVDCIKIEFNKKLVGNIKNNFRLVDPFICRKIKDYRKKTGKRPTKYDVRIYDLLLGENRGIIKRNYLKIAQAPMLMDKYIKQGKSKHIREKLNSIYRMYHQLGYLTNYMPDDEGARYQVDVLYPNSELFYKLRDYKRG